MSTNRYSSLSVYSHSSEEKEGNPAGEVGYQIDPIGYLDLWGYSIAKRTFDLIVTIPLLIAVLLPVGFVISVLIYLTSPGPIFYREERVGRFGRPFMIWKFRSMRKDAPEVHRVKARKNSMVSVEWRMQKQLKDPRITPLGGILRRWSIDELPQLINVFRGEMSLVGPRPIVKSECIFYGDLLRYYLEAVPGMTGIWQVSGRNQISYEQRAKLDRGYVTSWGLFSDIKILAQTIPAVLRRIGAS